MKTIDAAIVGVSLLCAAFAAGLWLGTANHDAKAPATCDVPAGEKLIAIEQLKDGVYCNHARAYGRDIKRRKAG
jgi:uncharacterized protein with FMN-binding domain